MQEEKKPMTKAQYMDASKAFLSTRKEVGKDPYRLRFHLQPPTGWLNDPNGLCQIGGTYHIYFQYTPFNPEGGTGLWGHMTTDDFIYYKEHEPAIYPDSAWDQNGAYSGSAYEEDGTRYFFYTGNVKYTDKNYDYTTRGREQNVILTTTLDGYCFSEKKLIMTNQDFPKDMSRHVRDPQVVRKNGRYYMILGARDLSDKGSVLLFDSDDLSEWKYKLRFTTEEAFGYMWECPNFAEIEEHLFVIVCPQGIKPQGLEYANAHQCGYFPLDYQFGEDSYQLKEFRQLDRGFDFYAPQVFKDCRNRTIMIGWMGMPDSGYGNELTVKNGWQHALTIPRELYLTPDGLLAQRPVEELKRLRKHGERIDFQNEFYQAVPVCFELNLYLRKGSDFSLRIRETAILSYKSGVLMLDMEKCGSGRKKRGVNIERIKNIKIISDSSSLEIFVNEGVEVFTTRIYDSLSGLSCGMKSADTEGVIEWYELVSDKN